MKVAPKGMLLCLASVALLGLGMLAWGAFLALKPRSGPVASVSPPEIRIAAAPGQAKVQATYEIRNFGGSDLLLGGVTTSCGCSDASLSSTRIPPGGKGTVVVEGRPPGSGERKVEVTIASNTKERALTLKLTMAGAAVPPYVADKSQAVSFGDVTSLGQTEDLFVDTREKRGKKQWIKEVRSTVPEVVCDGGLVEELDAGGGVVVRRYRYKASVRTMPPEGEFVGDLLVMSSAVEPRAILEIRVHGSVAPPVRSSPSSLLAHVDRGMDPPAFNFVLVGKGSAGELHAKLASACPDVYELRQLGQPGPRTIQFELRPRKRLHESLKTALVFKVDDSSASEIKVPITLICPTAASQSAEGASP